MSILLPGLIYEFILSWLLLDLSSIVPNEQMLENIRNSQADI